LNGVTLKRDELRDLGWLCIGVALTYAANFLPTDRAVALVCIFTVFGILFLVRKDRSFGLTLIALGVGLIAPYTRESLSAVCALAFLTIATIILFWPGRQTSKKRKSAKKSRMTKIFATTGKSSILSGTIFLLLLFGTIGYGTYTVRDYYASSSHVTQTPFFVGLLVARDRIETKTSFNIQIPYVNETSSNYTILEITGTTPCPRNLQKLTF
jgi:hypothetical protein